MKMKRVGLRVLVLLVIALALWFLRGDRSQSWAQVHYRLWERPGCNLLAVYAIWATLPPVLTDNITEQGPFLPWDAWSDDIKAKSLQHGLRRVGTERFDGLVVTTFERRDEADARWFYIVPENLGPERPWFRIIAMDSKHCLYTRFPYDEQPVIEKQKERPVDPIKVIKSICRQRQVRTETP